MIMILICSLLFLSFFHSTDRHWAPAGYLEPVALCDFSFAVSNMKEEVCMQPVFLVKEEAKALGLCRLRCKTVSGQKWIGVGGSVRVVESGSWQEFRLQCVVRSRGRGQEQASWGCSQRLVWGSVPESFALQPGFSALPTVPSTAQQPFHKFLFYIIHQSYFHCLQLRILMQKKELGGRFQEGGVDLWVFVK